MGAIDIQTNFSLKFVGYYIIHQLELLEALFTFATDINQRPTNLEDSIARIEEELELKKNIGK